MVEIESALIMGVAHAIAFTNSPLKVLFTSDYHVDVSNFSKHKKLIIHH